MASSKRVLLTGEPGIGKTTLIKRLVENLQANEMPVFGFYTEEVRNEQNKRNGFDIVTLDGKRAKLSRTVDCLEDGDSKRYRVGQYYVFPHNFEALVIPIFYEFDYGILVLDEIGKMELFSKKFKTLLPKMFARKYDTHILATVPLIRKKLPVVDAFVEDLKNDLIIVDKDNRNRLYEELKGAFRK